MSRPVGPEGPPRDHYQELTDRIIAALETGTPPWRRPWDPDRTLGPQSPINAVSGRHYHGINVLTLGMDMRAFQTGDPRWATFAQAKAKEWSVRKGEKSTQIFFYKTIEVEDRRNPEEMTKIPILKAHSVFHASQIESIPAYRAPSMEAAPWQRPDAAQVILDRSKAEIRIGGDRAFYSPSTDHIQLPPDKAFKAAPQWAAVALHELGHWTGHRDRMDRDLTGRFGSGAYAQEELRAELASVFTGAELGLPTDIPHHAAYISHWVKALKEDKREIFRAAGDAGRMSELILGFHPDLARSRAAEERVADTDPEPPKPTRTARVAQAAER